MPRNNDKRKSAMPTPTGRFALILPSSTNPETKAMITRFLAVSLTVLGTLCAPLAHAQFPNKPITMIVPFAAGGPTDTVARLLGQAMGTDLKQTIVVENVAGAGGTVAAGRVARADPDGY